MSDEEAVKAAARVVEGRAGGDDRPTGFPRDRVEALGRSGLLGLTVEPASGGGGAGPATAAAVVERIATTCASTATVLQSHYAAVAVLDRYGPATVRKEIAAGRHLAAVALAEPGGTGDLFGSGTAAPHAHGQVVDLTGCKICVPAAGEADSYLWSAGAFGGPGTSLWLVPANAPGLHVPAGASSIGLADAAVAPVTADPVRVPADNVLGSGGLVDEVVLPWFVVLGAAVALGVIDGTIDRVAGEAPPDSHAAVAELRVRADSVRSLRDDALAAGAPNAVTSLLALRAVSSGAAVAVTERATALLAEWGHDSGSAASTAVRRRRWDTVAASAIPPTPDSGLEHIVRGLWLAAPRAGSSRELVAAESSPRY